MSKKLAIIRGWGRLIALLPVSGRVLLGFLAAVLLAWEGVERALELRPDILPTPSRILLEFWRSAPLLREHGAVTCFEVLNGFLLAAAAAVLLAVLLGSSAKLYRVAGPIVSFLAKAPLVIFAPVLFVWFGFGTLPEVLMTFLLCLFPIAGGMMMGLQSIPVEMIDFVRATGAGWARSFLKVRLPMSLPGFFRGLRAAASFAIVGAMAGEFAASDEGLGHLMLEGMARMNTPLLFAALASIAMIWLALHLAISLLRVALIPWQVESE